MRTTTAIQVDRHLAGPRVLRPAQVSALLAAPDARTWRGRRDRALLAAMVLGGLRVGEACRLTREAVDLAPGGVIRLTFAGAKTGVTRTVTLPPTAAKALRGWLAEPRCHPHWIFAGRRNEHLSTRAARDVLAGYVKAAGLPGWLHCHSLRHTAGSMLMKATSDVYRVQRMLGHSDIGTTAKYYLAFAVKDADDSAGAMEKALHPSGGGPRVRKARRAA